MAYMTLLDYLRENGITYEAFGAQLGVAKSQVWRWANDERLPDLRTALEIERLTAGAVQPNDWTLATQETAIEGTKQ